MKYVGFVFIVLAGMFFGGCSGAGLVGVMGSPTRHEKKFPAEYELTLDKGQKMLVFVEQPAWLNINVNLRYHLTEAINKAFLKRVKLKEKNLVSYSDFLKFRTSEPDFASLSPVEVGNALGVEKILYVEVEDYSLKKTHETKYYKGSLRSRAVVLDVSKGEKVWPLDDASKIIKVGFEVEERGLQAAINRLSAACAHCTTRYLYDCPMDGFKIADDRSRSGWENWID